MHGFISAPLFHMSIFMPMAYCWDHYSFAIYFEIRVHDTLALLFFLKSALANQHLLYFLTNFRNVCSSYVKNAIGILIGIALNLLIALVL